jgi:uncharacterized protein YbjT (DUF2867 family)
VNVPTAKSPSSVFVTGGTGYLGRAVIPLLVARGHTVRALVRRGSEVNLPPGAQAVFGDALDQDTFAASVAPSDTFIQLVGVPHPSPAKAKLFRAIDLMSALAGIGAAEKAGVRHFVYVSVAQPAPMMKEYQAVRAEAEAALRATGLPATVLRPWYVLGPGHRWPYALLPIYKLCEWLPPTRAGARRLGLVTLKQMVGALVRAVEHPASGFEMVGVPGIRAADAS